MRVIVVLSPARVHFSTPSKNENQHQQDAVAEGQPTVGALLDIAARGRDDSYGVGFQGIAVLWMSRSKIVLQARLKVCARVIDAKHLGV